MVLRLQEDNHSMRKPTVPPGASKVKKRPLNTLEWASKKLREQGVKAAYDYLKSAKAKKRKDYTQLSLMLDKLARNSQARDPKTAMALAELAIKEDSNCTSSATLLVSLHDRLGNRDEAKEYGLSVANNSASSAKEVLQVANLLVRLGEDSLALEKGKAAFEELGRPLDQIPNIQYIAQRTCDWDFLLELEKQIESAYAEGREDDVGESPRTHLLWCDDEKTNIKVVSKWSRARLRIPARVKPLPPPEPLDGRRIRIGYLSSDYREHPTSRLVNGLFRNHDRSKFEIFLYCSGWDDGSPMRREIESHADHIYSVATLSDEDAADLIRSHKIDVLVELNGPTRANRMGVLCHRPAPVQIDYLGWPGSVGGRVVDYIIGDYQTVPQGSEELYPEKVIRIKDSYQVNDYASRSPLPAIERKKYKLPEGVPIIGMLNAINKVDLGVWKVWMEIMKSVPEAILWILDPGKAARKNMSRYCRQLGVPPSRIIAAPSVRQDDHLARLQLCDLMLDPWPYGGHTSTSDALFAGVPVIALKGNNFPSRVSGGLLKAAGLGELVLNDVDSYVAKAISLLRNPDELKRIKDYLASDVMKTGVFNARARAREIEAAYKVALQLVIDEKPAMHISIGKPPVDSAVASDINRVQSGQIKKTVEAVKKSENHQKTKLVLVLGPWSSGTSAMAGMLANAGLWAPGPFVNVRDPKTAATYENRVFRDLLRELASEQKTRLKVSSSDVTEKLKEFRDSVLPGLRARSQIGADSPVLLKHALPALMLKEFDQLFDLKLVVVMRSFEEIEATRQRRNWHSCFGRKGAEVIYGKIFHYLLHSETPFRAVRYRELLDDSESVIRDLASFCEIDLSAENLQKAMQFLKR